jgi:ribose transport system substrate-binding protein
VLVALVNLVVLAAMLAATASAGSTAVDPRLKRIPSLEGKTIAYIQTSSVEYFERSAQGAKAAVEALGGKLVIYNSKYDPATEVANVRTAIAKRVDGILLFSISQGTLASSARLAKEAGIPVANYYGYTPKVAKDLVGFWTGGNPYQIGVLDGKAMAALLKRGDEVAAVQGQLGRGEVEQYQAGFESQLEPKGIKVVAKPTSHWSRQEAFQRTQEILTKYPNLKGLYCHNDDTTVGCVQALKQAGKKPGDVKLVTENGSPTGLDLIKQGWLQANVTLPPPLESAMATRALAQMIGGQKVNYPVPCHTPISLVTKANVNRVPAQYSWIPSKEGAVKGLLTPCANQKNIYR